MNKRRPSIHLLVSLIVLLPIAVVSAALLTLSGWTSGRVEAALGSALVRSTANTVRLRMLHALTEAERTSDLYAHRLESGSLPPDPSPAYVRLMYESMLIRPGLGSIAFAWPDGRCLYVIRDADQYVTGYASGNGPGQTTEHRLNATGDAVAEPLRTFTFDAVNRPWYTTGAKSPDGAWTDVYLWFSGTPTAIGKEAVASVAYARSVYLGGQFAGVLSIEVTLPQVSRILAETQIAEVGNLFVVDENEMLLAQTIPLLSDSQLPPISTVAHHDAAAAAAVLRNRNGAQEVSRIKEKNVYIQDLITTSSLPWKLIAVMPDSTVTQEVRALQRNAILAGGVLVVVAMLVAVYLARTLSRPVYELAQHVRTIGEGRFDQEIGIATTAEFAALSKAVNDMTRQLREQVALRAAIEAARRAEESRSAFFNRVTHELRTPLNAIIGYTEMLDEQECVRQDPVAREDVRRVLQASQQLLRLINDLLDLAKAEAGQLKLNKTSFRLDDLIREVEETAAPLLMKNDNQFMVECVPDARLLETDRDKLRQILLNLLSNAGKFTRGGTIFLRASRDDAHLHLNVTDTGIGIARDQRSRIFEPFVQGSVSTPGTGLGLTITRQFVELLGGELELRSTPGQGTSVDIYLPTAFASADAEAV